MRYAGQDGLVQSGWAIIATWIPAFADSASATCRDSINAPDRDNKSPRVEKPSFKIAHTATRHVFHELSRAEGPK
jgi:hypothetical protein